MLSSQAGRSDSKEKSKEELYSQAQGLSYRLKTLAALDFNSALDVAAYPSCAKHWKTTSQGIFTNRIETAAFFESAFVLMPKCDKNGFQVTYYNLWVNSALAVKYEQKGKELRISGMKIVSPGTPGIISAFDAGQLAQALDKRLDKAAAADFAGLATSPDTVKATRKALTSYCRMMREHFAPEAKRENLQIRNTILALQKKLGLSGAALVKSGALPAVNSAAVASAPINWRKALRPVYLTTGKNMMLVTFIDPAKPGKWLMAELKPAGRTYSVSSVTVTSFGAKPEGGAK